jgi:hypothetical protein
MTSPPKQEARTNFVYAQPIEYTGQIYTDQTGPFPVRSSRGYQYILVCYDYDSNAILTEPMKNSSKAELLRAYTVVHLSLSKNWTTKPPMVSNAS